MASIARAFTMRHRKRSDTNKSNDAEDVPAPPPLSPKRAASMRYSQKGVDIRKISSPVQLLSTTNMLTYEAPDVTVAQAQRKASMSVSSGSSRDDNSDASSHRSRGTMSTDVSSVEGSPVSSPHLDKQTSYFESTPAVKGSSTLRRSISTLEIRQHSLEEHPRSESPAIPQRHPSHSKRAHAELARKRSLQSVSRAASTASQGREVHRSSAELFSALSQDAPSSRMQAPTSHPQSHPFGKELEQLDVVAEEFSGTVNDVQSADDLRAMKQRGLVRFCADDYLTEIEPLFGGLFGGPTHHRSHLAVPAMAWI